MAMKRSSYIQQIILVILLLLSWSSAEARNRSVRKFSIQVKSSFSGPKNLEIGFLVHPFYSNFPVMHFSYETDWFFDNYVTDNKFVTSFGSDFGGLIDLSPLHIIPTFGYLYQSGFNEERYDRTPEFINHAWYYSLSAKLNFRGMYVIVTGRQFLDDIVFLNNYRRSLINVGIGIYMK